MARLREYDPEKVLELAMITFWTKGFEGTSIRDLAKACRLTTRSMYNAYPDKFKFFEATLDHYHQNVLKPIIEILEVGKGFQALEQFVEVLGQGSTSDGCLYFNTSASRHLVSPKVAKKIDLYIARLRKVIFEKLEEERSLGNFNGDSELRSDQIISSLMGFIQSLKAGVPRKKASAAFAQVILDIKNE